MFVKSILIHFFLDKQRFRIAKLNLFPISTIINEKILRKLANTWKQGIVGICFFFISVSETSYKNIHTIFNPISQLIKILSRDVDFCICVIAKQIILNIFQ